MDKEASSLLFSLFLSVLLLSSSMESSVNPSTKETDGKSTEKRDQIDEVKIRKEKEPTFSNPFGFKVTEYDSLDPPSTALPVAPVTNPVTTPTIVTVPGTIPVTFLPNPATLPAPVTNPVTNPPSTFPVNSPVPATNPVTTPSTFPVNSPLPATNPVTTPGVYPANTPVPVTNPVTTPSTFPVNSPVPATNPVTTPGVYPANTPVPVTNPVTTYPVQPGGGTGLLTPPTGNSFSGQNWCVAMSGASEFALQSALDYACGIGGADCSSIQQGGSCYVPDTLQNHASYAFNSYYQKYPVSTSCNFGGSALITNSNPSTGSCIYPSSSSSSVNPLPTPTTSSSTGATVPGSVTTPTVMNPANPNPGATTGFGLSPPPGMNISAVSGSDGLQPSVKFLLLMTGIVMGRFALKS